MQRCPGRGSAARPPPPVAAPLVPRCALLPAATPRMGGFAAWRSGPRCGMGRCETPISPRHAVPTPRTSRPRTFSDLGKTCDGSNGTRESPRLMRARIVRSTAAQRPMRGVAAGRSAQRGTSGAATGGGGRAALPRPGSAPSEQLLFHSYVALAQRSTTKQTTP